VASRAVLSSIELVSIEFVLPKVIKIGFSVALCFYPEDVVRRDMSLGLRETLYAHTGLHALSLSRYRPVLLTIRFPKLPCNSA
jgi:hypothetical protein